MLTRRDMLTRSIQVTTGAALAAPIGQWVGAESTGIAAREVSEVGQIGMVTVAGIEQATERFSASDAAVGGGLGLRGATGQLRYAVDLARHASYTEAVGQRMLTAIADLAAIVGWMAHDMAMTAARRYSVYALRAAHEAGTERARLRAGSILVDLAYQARDRGDPKTALRMVEVAFEQVPADRHRLNAVRAQLHTYKALMLAPLGTGHLAEIRHAVNMSFDLSARAGSDDPDPVVGQTWRYANEAELAGVAAASYRDLAGADRRLAEQAERLALRAVACRPAGFTRSKVLDQITLARARFATTEYEQACRDAETALHMAGTVAASRRVTTRLRALFTDTRPYQAHSDVRDLRERLRQATRAENPGAGVNGSVR
jgi:hypothetical protein